ncbi:MAG: SRPBCC family protein [bacterium]
MNVESKMVPPVSSFTTSPLRNRMRVELKAPASEVWSLLGDPSRYPEYSSGLERVEARTNSNGVFAEYVCHFKPQAVGEAGVVYRVHIPWYEPNRGYASIDEEPNAFGTTNSLTLVTLEPSKEGTIATWGAYYNAGDLEMNRASLDQALADIGKNLVSRFGGAILERYVDR